MRDLESTKMAAIPKRLGELEEDILRRLLDAYERIEQTCAPEFRACFGAWGVRWRDLRNEGGWFSKAECAAASRALCRLEKLGLVQRRNQVSGDKYSPPDERYGTKHRTTNVRFTAEGRAMAEQLRQHKVQ
jgi:hypothetical protein